MRTPFFSFRSEAVQSDRCKHDSIDRQLSLRHSLKQTDEHTKCVESLATMCNRHVLLLAVQIRGMMRLTHATSSYGAGPAMRRNRKR